jgi:prepilin peptidase CpaA
VSFLDIFIIFFVWLATVFDLKERRIPNWLICFALIGGVLLNAWQGTAHVINSLYGFLLGIGIFFLPFALGIIGAGDVKLVGAIGAILGVDWLPRVLFYAVSFGSILAFISVLLNGVDWQTFGKIGKDVKVFVLSRGTILPEGVHAKDSKGTKTIPYGVAIALGTLVAVYIDSEGRWSGF